MTDDPYGIAALEAAVATRSAPEQKMAEGYCPKCKGRTSLGQAVSAVLKNGRRAVKGRCVECGNSLFKILDGTPPMPAADARALFGSRSRFRKVAPEAW